LKKDNRDLEKFRSPVMDWFVQDLICWLTVPGKRMGARKSRAIRTATVIPEILMNFSGTDRNFFNDECLDKSMKLGSGPAPLRAGKIIHSPLE
jgi:hypothetical protein